MKSILTLFSIAIILLVSGISTAESQDPESDCEILTSLLVDASTEILDGFDLSPNRKLYVSYGGTHLLRPAPRKKIEALLCNGTNTIVDSRNSADHIVSVRVPRAEVMIRNTNNGCIRNAVLSVHIEITGQDGEISLSKLATHKTSDILSENDLIKTNNGDNFVRAFERSTFDTRSIKLMLATLAVFVATLIYFAEQ